MFRENEKLFTQLRLFSLLHLTHQDMKQKNIRLERGGNMKYKKIITKAKFIDASIFAKYEDDDFNLLKNIILLKELYPINVNLMDTIVKIVHLT